MAKMHQSDATLNRYEQPYGDKPDSKLSVTV